MHIYIILNYETNSSDLKLRNQFIELPLLPYPEKKIRMKPYFCKDTLSASCSSLSILIFPFINTINPHKSCIIIISFAIALLTKKMKYKYNLIFLVRESPRKAQCIEYVSVSLFLLFYFFYFLVTFSTT